MKPAERGFFLAGFVVSVSWDQVVLHSSPDANQEAERLLRRAVEVAFLSYAIVLIMAYACG